jgi:hypothetical protein
MNSNKPFNLLIFTDSTKKLCMCSATAMFIIILFVISPLSNFFKTTIFMKIVALLLLVYTIYLTIEQINALKLSTSQSEEIKSQLNVNLLSSYVFTLFIGLLIIFVVKSFF